ncbi:hypothetical protein RhiirA4_487414 [Rhizophagus irregularis]|uniref:Uncharacterized protein n=1 Tax=Rhizophagus irregularis TaxID=588596 RepID=A0A2I1HSR8_9GLOM|nr:hypothetical protein RhiirA4_487414 [Rhizophagus irregularis]
MICYNPEVKDNIHEITIYDIPSRWTYLNVLSHLKNWGQVIAIKLNHNRNTPSLPSNWDLKQRKEQERFQVILIGVPASTITAILYPNNPAQSILTFMGCKAFKLIQDRGTHKLITYYES